MQFNLVVIFFLLNVLMGLAQIWIGAIYWVLHKHELVALDVLVRDGSLLLFGAGLVASATYNVIPKPSALQGRRTFFFLVIILMTIAVFATGLMYGMELTSAQDANKPVELGKEYFTVQVFWAAVAVIYAFWVAYITDGLKEESQHDLY